MPPKAAALPASKQKDAFREQQLRALAGPKEQAPKRKKGAESTSGAAAAPSLTSIVTNTSVAAPPTHKRARREALDIRRCLYDIIEYLKSRDEEMDLDQLLDELRFSEGTPESVEQLKTTMREHEKFSFNGNLVSFKPKFNVRSSEELLALLRDFHNKGLGGIRADELKESYKTVLLDVEALVAAGHVHVVKRKDPKIDVFYYRDRSQDLAIDDSIRERWRQCDVTTRQPNEIERALRAAGDTPLRVEHQAREVAKFKKSARAGKAQAKHESVLMLERQGIIKSEAQGGGR